MNEALELRYQYEIYSSGRSGEYVGASEGVCAMMKRFLHPIDSRPEPCMYTRMSKFLERSAVDRKYNVIFILMIRRWSVAFLYPACNVFLYCLNYL